MDARDITKEFKHFQGQDMGKVGFIQDLVRGIGKIIPLKTNNANEASSSYITKVSPKIKMYQCKNCGHVMTGHSETCDQCYLTDINEVSIDDVYNETVEMYLSDLPNRNEFYSRQEIFKKKLPMDYRTHHLDFIDLTSSEELYDAYRYDDQKAVVLLNKIINAASGETRSKFRKLARELNEQSANRSRVSILEWLEMIKKAKMICSAHLSIFMRNDF